MKRIARGIFKFVINNPDPFIVRIGQTGFGKDKMQYPIEKPLTTITTKAEHCLVTPTMDADRKKLLKVVPVNPRMSQESINEVIDRAILNSSLVAVQLEAVDKEGNY